MMLKKKEAEEQGKQFPGAAFFLSGAGGVGKSFIVSGITHRAHEIFHTTLEDMTSLVTATTGLRSHLQSGVIVFELNGWQGTLRSCWTVRRCTRR